MIERVRNVFFKLKSIFGFCRCYCSEIIVFVIILSKFDTTLVSLFYSRDHFLYWFIFLFGKLHGGRGSKGTSEKENGQDLFLQSHKSPSSNSG